MVDFCELSTDVVKNLMNLPPHLFEININVNV